MPAHRMNMRMIKDVLRLKFDGGFSHDRIAASRGDRTFGAKSGGLV